jgi:hypothetical protein
MFLSQGYMDISQATLSIINYPFGTGIHCPGYSAKDRDLNGLLITKHFIP